MMHNMVSGHIGHPGQDYLRVPSSPSPVLKPCTQFILLPWLRHTSYGCNIMLIHLLTYHLTDIDRMPFSVSEPKIE